MRKYQKGFLPIWALLLIAVGIAAAAIVVFPGQKNTKPGVEREEPIQQSASPTPSASPAFDISTWKTYRNAEQGFEVKYPGDWDYRSTSDTGDINFSTASSFREGGESGGVAISPLSQYRGKIIEDVYSGNPDGSERQIDLAKECAKVIFSEKSAYDCYPVIAFAGERVILVSNLGLPFEIIDYRQDKTSNQILSTFKFIETTKQ